MKDRSDTLFLTANEFLSAAEHENERAEEDVVTHLICANSRQSISNYLAGFLIRREIPVSHPVSLTSLLEQCKTIDARFEHLDLNHLECRFDTQDRQYCLDHEHVDACLRIAQQARDMVLSDTPPY